MQSNYSIPKITGYSLLLLAILVGLCVGGASGCKSWNRYQKRADANNKVKVTHIMIRNINQRKQIEQQQANIRVIHAQGIRRAQDKINKTLTGLYVQHEMVNALDNIARSGRNNTVIYIPVGANGVPLVSNTNQPQSVGTVK